MKALLFNRLFSGMRHPWLFAVLLGLLAVDLVVVDPLPLVDEALLAVLTLLLGTWRKKTGETVDDDGRAPRDVTDRGSDR